MMDGVPETGRNRCGRNLPRRRRAGPVGFAANIVGIYCTFSILHLVSNLRFDCSLLQIGHPVMSRSRRQLTFPVSRKQRFNW